MKRYDLSKIMKRAHCIYRHTFNATFSCCLKKAWTESKETVTANEGNAKRADEYKSKYGNRDYRNSRSYYGSHMGRNDWARDYRNDIRAAVNFSMNH